MKRSDNRISWKEIFRLNLRAIKTLYQAASQTILSRICFTAWQAITPYLGIYLSALLIGELAGARNPERLRQLVLLSLMTAAIVALGNAFFTCWRSAALSSMWFRGELPHMKKLLSMDFASVDNAENQMLRTKVLEFHNSGGLGLFELYYNLEEIISAVLTLLGGITLTVTLFTRPVPETAGIYTMLNHPLFLVAILAVMLLITYLAPVLRTKAGAYWFRNADDHALGNRVFLFWGNNVTDPGNASDARMYRHDLPARRITSAKDHIFGSAGQFAKWARGPIGAYHAAASAISVVFTGIVYGFVCLKAWAGAFGVGEITQYVASITKVAAGVSELLGVLGKMRNNAPFLVQEFQFLDIPNEMYQGSLTVEKRRDRNYEIEFRNVSFRYPGTANYALRNISIKFRIGQRLAVVGMNGSGKTTFIKLLCRLYDPTEGEILLNGIDIRKYNYLEYLSLFSVVFQDFKLFSFQLGENIAGSVSYDEARVRDCLIKAGFGDRLRELPQGLHTYLYKDFDKAGIDISGGEAQKIALARALYKDAPFIILDEPTAALDPIAEAEIYSKFDEIVGDKTAIYISHRLSSCRFCDKIAVFDQGEIVQIGTHEELLADENGKYHELWHAQAQYYTKSV